MCYNMMTTNSTNIHFILLSFHTFSLLHRECAVLIQGTQVGKAKDTSKKGAKESASLKALEELQRRCYTLRVSCPLPSVVGGGVVVVCSYQCCGQSCGCVRVCVFHLMCIPLGVVGEDVVLCVRIGIFQFEHHWD